MQEDAELEAIKCFMIFARLNRYISCKEYTDVYALQLHVAVHALAFNMSDARLKAKPYQRFSRKLAKFDGLMDDGLVLLQTAYKHPANSTLEIRRLLIQRFVTAGAHQDLSELIMDFDFLRAIDRIPEACQDLFRRSKTSTRKRTARLSASRCLQRNWNSKTSWLVSDITNPFDFTMRGSFKMPGMSSRASSSQF